MPEATRSDPELIPQRACWAMVPLSAHKFVQLTVGKRRGLKPTWAPKAPATSPDAASGVACFKARSAVRPPDLSIALQTGQKQGQHGLMVARSVLVSFNVDQLIADGFS